MVVARGWGRKEWVSCCLIGTELQFCKMNWLLEIVCTTMRMYLTLLNLNHYHLKMLKIVNFISCIFYHNEIKEKNIWKCIPADLITPGMTNKVCFFFFLLLTLINYSWMPGASSGDGGDPQRIQWLHPRSSPGHCDWLAMSATGWLGLVEASAGPEEGRNRHTIYLLTMKHSYWGQEFRNI